MKPDGTFWKVSTEPDEVKTATFGFPKESKVSLPKRG